MKAIVIIPTYNEKDNIAHIINAVLQLPLPIHILIVDDGSPDGTAAIVKNMQLQLADTLFLEERKGKLGLGTAYIHGFKWALARDYDFICEMDADFSHPPAQLVDLINACKNGADVAIGSRYIKGGGVINWPKGRVFLSRGASFYTQLITFMPIKDPTAGFICYTKQVLKTINLEAIRFTGYAFQIEMKFAAWKLGFKIKEIPILFTDRKFGVSKMNKGIIQEGILGVLKLRWLSFFKTYRKKITQENTSTSIAQENEVLITNS
jgi:dolichol-phosphate mannosyltransferase